MPDIAPAPPRLRHGPILAMEAGDARHRPSPPAAGAMPGIASLHGQAGPCLSRGGAGAMPGIASLHGQAPKQQNSCVTSAKSASLISIAIHFSL
jgi:hypothetical protein